MKVFTLTENFPAEMVEQTVGTELVTGDRYVETHISTVDLEIAKKYAEDQLETWKDSCDYADKLVISRWTKQQGFNGDTTVHKITLHAVCDDDTAEMVWTVTEMEL